MRKAMKSEQQPNEKNISPAHDDHFGRAMQRISFTGFLNADCWKQVLDYLSLRDVVSLGLVCCQWHAVVQHYLHNVRLRIETITNFWHDDDVECHGRKFKTLVLKDDPIFFNAVIHGFGNLVKDLVYDARIANKHILINVGKECPNLEDISFVRLTWLDASCDWAANFTRLKRIRFENCDIRDSCVSQLMKNNNIEELVFRMTNTISGRFFLTQLTDKSVGGLTNLNNLIISNCIDFNLNHLLSSLEPVNQLARVRKLELRDLSYSRRMRLELILEKMPQLEHLSLYCEEMSWEEIASAAARLKNLQYLCFDGEAFSGSVLKEPNLLLQRRRRSRHQRWAYWYRPYLELAP